MDTPKSKSHGVKFRAPSINSCADMKFLEEVFEFIAPKLSLLYAFRLRLVCKHWNVMFHDINFLERYFQISRCAPMYVWRTQEAYLAYSPESNSWQRWPESFFLMDKSWYKISSGANGLLLAESKVDSQIAFCVGNPMTRSYRELPRAQQGRLNRRNVMRSYRELPKAHQGRVNRNVTRSYKRILKAGGVWPTKIIFDESSKSCKMFGENSEDYLAYYCKLHMLSDYFLHMYDSEHESWKLYGEWGGGQTYTYSGIPTFHQGVLHCLVTHHEWVDIRHGFYRQKHQTVYYGDAGGFHSLCTVPESMGILFMHMFEWQGSLLLVGGKTSDQHRMSSVKLWQLDEDPDEEKIAWTEKMSMPDDVLNRFSPPDPDLHLQFSCSNGDDYVYFTTYSADSTFARHFVCNLSQSSWWEAPELLPLYQRSLKSDSSGFCGSFLWKPSFDNIF